MSKIKILVLDDEAAIRFGVREFLQAHGYDVDEADTCRTAEEMYRASRPDAAIVDYLLPDGTALDLSPRLKAIDPDVPLIIVTAHGSIDLAVQAIKECAEQFLTKPTELPALLVVLERLLEVERRHIERVLAEEGGQVAAAAQRLGIPKSSLYHKLKKLEIAR